MSARSDRVRVIEQAEKYVRGGRIREAIAEYEKLAAGDPQDVGTLNIIGDLYVRLAQNDRAVEFFLKVEEEYERRGLFSQALAICKKVHKFAPESADYALKLGDLFGQQGFVADAKGVYADVARRFAAAGRAAEAAAVFEKIVKLDREDVDARRALARLLREAGSLEAAVGQLDDIADVCVEKDRLDDAEAALGEALALKPGDSRTVAGLVEVHRRRGQTARAVELLERELAASPDNVQLLSIFGNLHFEAGETKKAEEIFARIVTSNPLNVNARIKLGRIEILQDRLDHAFELFEPLVNNLVKKHRDEKAIGLLGLILENQKPHLPSLERLALIYRSNKDLKKLEVVDRAILDELRKRGEKERMVGVHAELLEIRPDDAELIRDARALKEDLGLAVEDEVGEDAPALADKDREAIRDAMAQADLYLQQGLVRIARRLLENLRFRYPEDPQIARKIAVIDEVRTHIDEDEIRRRVEKTSQLEAQFKEKAAGRRAEARAPARTEERKAAEDEPAAPKAGAKKRPDAPFKDEVLQGEKVSTVDIFAETDIVPFVGTQPGERRYHDLKAAAAAESRGLAAARARQLEGDALPFERELSAIVAEFRRDYRAKPEPVDGESHYQLGLAFMSQGLVAEAVEELIDAARDKKLAVDSYSLIGQSYAQTRNFEEALKWLKLALAETRPGTEEHFAVLFEVALVLEAADDRGRAIALFREIRGWNPGYRGVSARLESLERSSSG